MISADRDGRNEFDVEMYRVPPISIEDIPEMLLCKFSSNYYCKYKKI